MLFVFIAVFAAGLMIGRTLEYLARRRRVLGMAALRRGVPFFHRHRARLRSGQRYSWAEREPRNPRKPRQPLGDRSLRVRRTIEWFIPAWA